MKMSKACSNCILAVDAGGTFLKAALVELNSSDNSSTIIENTFVKVPVDSNGDMDSIRESYIKLAASGAGIASDMGLKLNGIGVCIPGPFDYANGICLMKHKYQSIYGVPMRPWLEKAAGEVPISFVHDSTAFILGAASPERYSAFKHIGAVLIGTGLGFATMIDSKVHNNPQGGPSISIFARPFRNGTAEDYVSRRAIISHYKKLYPCAPPDMDVIDIVGLARSGQPEAMKAFEAAGQYLAEIIHDILCDNRYDCLLLGGAISKSSDLFITALRHGLADVHTLSLIEQAADIDNAPILGAAKAVLT